MKSVSRTLLRSTLLGSVAAASLAAAPTFAVAQSSEGVDVSEIVVTGSRIRRAELTSVQPIQVITSETMERRGFTNVADALNEMPSSGIPVNPIGDQGSFGTGRNFVNIFNLGSNRTLTLVNGRRFVGGNPASIFTGANAGGQVDLNVIPTGLIDRIETVQAGGSAVYGSDAIAGVINIITKSEYDGIEINGLYGVSDEGDAKSYRGRILAGHKFFDDRLNVYGSYEYNQTSALGYVDRYVTARQQAFAANPANTGGSDNIPGSIIIENRRIPEVTLGGLPFRSNASGSAIGGIASSFILTMPDPANPANRIPAQFGPGGTLIPFNPGTFYQASIASGGDGMNLAQLTSLQSPVKRHVATAFGKYEITDHIRASAELLYSKVNAYEPYNQPIYNAPLFGGNSAALRMSTANPFLTSQARAAILSQTNPLTADAASPGDRIFFLSRASVDIGPNKTTAEGETYRSVVGLDGDFEALGRKLFWNVSANNGESKGTFSSPNIDQSRFLQAIDAVRDSSGNVVCRDVTARAAGCAPLNLFGLGSPSQAALDYVGVQFVSEFKLLQTDYEANLVGSLYDLPAGPIGFAVGYEYRAEKSDFNPNAPQEAGIGRSAAITAIVGKFHTSEFYGEGSLPVFGGDFTYPLLHLLELEGSYRKIDHSLAGKDDAWSYGGRWSPFADLTIRAHKSRSFRAPAITETSLPTATSFFTATDPCDSRNINSGPNPATRAANCAADFQAAGLPANFSLTSQVQAATVQGTTSGNPGLKNEIADQWTAGFVYEPRFVPSLAIHFDWVHIDLANAIANFNLTSILQVCYDSPDRPADACNRFQRGLASGARPGQILSNGDAAPGGGTSAGPSTGFINAGYTHFEGFTAGIDYRIELADWLGGAFGGWNSDPGRVDFNFDLFHVKRQETSVTGLGFDLNRDQGEIGNAKYQWKLETEYLRDPIAVTWTVNYTAASSFNNDFTLETRYPLQVDEYFVHDLAFTYDLSDWTEKMGVGLTGAQARFIVHNVGDQEPPYGTTGVGVYDVIGRYYQFGLTARF